MTTSSKAQRIAEAVRAASVQAALAAYEQAAISGLCHEGAWECAIGAIRALKVEEIVAAIEGAEES